MVDVDVLAGRSREVWGRRVETKDVFLLTGAEPDAALSFKPSIADLNAYIPNILFPTTSLSEKYLKCSLPLKKTVPVQGSSINF